MGGLDGKTLGSLGRTHMSCTCAWHTAYIMNNRLENSQFHSVFKLIIVQFEVKVEMHAENFFFRSYCAALNT